MPVYTDEHHNYCMLPNECSWSHCKDNHFRTRNEPYYGIKENNTLKSVDKYKAAFSNGLVKLFDGDYWKMSMQRISSNSLNQTSSSDSSNGDITIISSNVNK